MNMPRKVYRMWFVWLLVALPGTAWAGEDDYSVTYGPPEVYSPEWSGGHDDGPGWAWDWWMYEHAVYEETQTWDRYWDRVWCGVDIEIQASAHQASSNPPSLYGNSWAEFEQIWIWSGPPGVEPNRMSVDYQFAHTPIGQDPRGGGDAEVFGSRPVGAGTTGYAYANGWGGSTLCLEAADPSYGYDDVLRASGSGRGEGTLFGTPSLFASAWVEPMLEGDEAETIRDPNFEPWGEWGFRANGSAEANNHDHNGVFSTSKPTYVLVCTTTAGCGAEGSLSMIHPNWTGGESSTVYVRPSGGADIKTGIVVSVLDD